MSETSRVTEAVRKMRHQEGWAKPGANVVVESEMGEAEARRSARQVTEAIRNLRRGGEQANLHFEMKTEGEAGGDTLSQSDMSDLYGGLSHQQLDPNYYRSQDQHRGLYDLGPSDESISTPKNKRSPGASTAGSSTDKTLSPGLRRVKVVKHVPSTGNLESVIEVDVAAESQNVPKVRVSSPPSWLKEPTHTPGSIEGKLRRVTSREGPLTPSQAGIDAVLGHQDNPSHPNVPPGGRRQSQQVRKAESHAHLRPSEIKQAKSRGSQYQDATTKTAEGDPANARRVSTGSAMPGRDFTSATTGTRQRRYSWRQGVGGLAAGTQQSEVDMSPKSVSEIRMDRTTAETVEDSQCEDEDDIGIQGLTIVLHLKGKDDLVISTDLTRNGLSL
ncbi:hypothetical protein B0T14DRAFT_564787 [Immersiella caudata]|uniref:Uncharacterized protein n=1 Tax=Immersiella caudata TaxID=314043 RepID=A0AA39WXY5_9PEZI|nr:hypothetical protein B0T14DRAFT_564787 [Immersiella caudata]